MKVTGTFQVKTNVYPCPPLPMLHSPARKMKSESKNRDWRVNPMARNLTQHQNRTSSPSSSSSSSPETSPSHSCHQISDIPLPSTSYQQRVPLPSTGSYHYQQITPRIILEKQKYDGVRKNQYKNMNAKFANLTMALNTAYQKSQEQAEKRIKMETNIKDNSDEVMSG